MLPLLPVLFRVSLCYLVLLLLPHVTLVTLCYPCYPVLRYLVFACYPVLPCVKDKLLLEALKKQLGKLFRLCIRHQWRAFVLAFQLE